MFYIIVLYQKLPNTVSCVIMKQVLFCKGGVCFWDQFLGWGWLVPQGSGGGWPKKGGLAELRFLGGGGKGGVWTKRAHLIFQGGPDTLEDTMATRIDFKTWIWSTRHCGMGQEMACWFQCWKNCSSWTIIF